MRPSRTPALLAAGAVLAGGALAGCGPSDSGGDGAGGPIAVAASDTSCKLGRTELPAGTHTFEVKNSGSQVTEFYIYADGDRIMAEVENIGPGLSQKLIAELPAGRYQGACKPGMTGKGIRTALTVTGKAPAHTTTDAKLAEATRSYQRFVESQTGALIAKTGEFVAAVKAGNVAQAKALFPVARTYWERIEPVAESFGDLDPAVDARENDVEPGAQWTGFHRIEKDLWGSGDVSRDGAIADKLLADVKLVVTKSKTVTFTPVQLAGGSKELLDEVARGKVTGEEDRYSHTDLWDFRANVDGSRAAIAALRPALAERDPALLRSLDERFAAIDRLLDSHARAAGFRLYNELSKDEVKTLAEAVEAVSEPLSKVAAVVAAKK